MSSSSSILSVVLNAFRAEPSLGQVTAPLFRRLPEGLALTAETMTPWNAHAAAESLIPLLRQTAQPEDPWARDLFSDRYRVSFSNPAEGLSVRLELGRGTARALTRSDLGFCVSVRRFGDFGDVTMTQAVDLGKRRPEVVTLYEIRLEGPGVLGLREFLGLRRELPVFDLSLDLLHRLTVPEDGHGRNPYEAFGVSSLLSEWKGRDPEGGADVVLVSGLDEVSLKAYGEIRERLTLEVYPTEESPALAHTFLEVWLAAEEIARHSNARSRPSEIREQQAAYREWVRETYGTDAMPGFLATQN